MDHVEARRPAARWLPGWIDCTIHAVHDAGDHYVVLGRVEALTVGEHEEAEPLVFYRSAYRALS